MHRLLTPVVNPQHSKGELTVYLMMRSAFAESVSGIACCVAGVLPR